jgi:peptidoglycan/LPS O-acetylase OafA/YrhL
VLVVASLVIANATYRYVEVPFQKLGRTVAARQVAPVPRAT